MTDDEQPHQLNCATYTHARRHPMVIGQIGGWTPPFQLTMPQVAVLLVGLLIEVKTWQWWLGYLPSAMAVVVALVLPVLLAWVVRRARFEGRSIGRAALGWLNLLSVPRGGQVRGRPNNPARAVALGRHSVFVAYGDDRP